MCVFPAINGDNLSAKIENSQWFLHRIPCENESKKPYRIYTFSLPLDYVRRKIQERLNSGINLSLIQPNSFICGHIYESGVFKYLKDYTVSGKYLEVKLYDKRHTSITQ